MREIPSVGAAYQELEEVKQKLAAIVKSKGYQDLVQWDTPDKTTKVLASGMNEKLTENLVRTLEVAGEG